MSSSVSKKASSFVVAASMGAVEALKDQAGLCRWDCALRSLYQRAAASAMVTGRAAPVSLPSQAAGNGAAAAASSPAACAGGRARPRRPEEEKLHKAYHLVCWGPN